MIPSAGGELSFWWFFGLVVLFSLFWLATLVPFALAVWVRQDQPPLGSGNVFEVREAILGLNNDEPPYQILQDSETELRIIWNPVDQGWRERFARVKLSTSYAARLLLDAARSEVRMHESLGHSNLFIGFQGGRARFNGDHPQVHGMINTVWSGTAFGIQPGWPPRIGGARRFSIDTSEAVRKVEEVIRIKGWSLRPVLWGFEASQWAASLSTWLTPPFMRGWSRLRYWSVLHAISWLGMIGATIVFAPPPSDGILLALGVFGGIAGIQGLILGLGLLLRRLDERGRGRTSEQGWTSRSPIADDATD